MKKRKYAYIIMSLLLLGATGCGTQAETVKDTTGSILAFAETENTKETPTPTVTSTPTPTAVPTINLSKEQEESKKTEDSAEVVEQPEISAPVDYNAFNRLLSLDIDSAPSLFCVDAQTGVSYFVNVGSYHFVDQNDNFIYRIKDGKTELVVDIPAQELNVYNGLLYFMVEHSSNYDYDYDLGDKKAGDIYCYNPTSDTVELVYAAGAIEGSMHHKLRVDENGIYFSYMVLKEDTGTSKKFTRYPCYLPFGATEPVRDMSNRVEAGWENYYFLYSASQGFRLMDRGEGPDKDIKQLSIRPYQYCVVGDNLYSVSFGSSVLSCLNLRTGEEIKYDFAEVLLPPAPDMSGVVEFHSFVVKENEIWVAGTSKLCHLNLQTGEINCYALRNEEGKSVYINNLYTDGEEIYANIVSTLDKFDESRRFDIVRILTDEIKTEGIIDDSCECGEPHAWMDTLPYMTVEYLVQ